MALGDGADGFAIDQRVTCPINLPRPTPATPQAYIALGSELDGAFAQYCLVEAVDLYDVSDSPLSDIEIAAIPCAFGTAENPLTRTAVCDGQSVLITGASGGVGLAAVQLAALRGARVTCVTSPAKANAVRTAGARHILERDATPPENRFDAVIHVVAGGAWPALVRALRAGGHYAVSGAIAGPTVTADPRDLYLRDITIHGCTCQAPEMFERLVRLANAGDIRPLISKTYTLAQIDLAQDEFIPERYPGKLVLVSPRNSYQDCFE